MHPDNKPIPCLHMYIIDKEHALIGINLSIIYHTKADIEDELNDGDYSTYPFTTKILDTYKSDQPQYLLDNIINKFIIYDMFHVQRLSNNLTITKNNLYNIHYCSIHNIDSIPNKLYKQMIDLKRIYINKINHQIDIISTLSKKNSVKYNQMKIRGKIIKFIKEKTTNMIAKNFSQKRQTLVSITIRYILVSLFLLCPASMAYSDTAK